MHKMQEYAWLLYLENILLILEFHLNKSSFDNMMMPGLLEFQPGVL